jgi:hypothetical protein
MENVALLWNQLMGCAGEKQGFAPLLVGPETGAVARRLFLGVIRGSS